MRLRVAALALAVLTTACVVGSERRPSRVGAARGSVDPAGDDPLSALRGDPGCRRPATEKRPPAPSAGAVWIDGNCHWNGVAYEWTPGRWERALPR